MGEKLTTKVWASAESAEPFRVFQNRKEISEYVGYPVLSACEDLYDKNIRTIESIWKKENVENYKFVCIIVDYDSLSEENKKIAEKISEELNTKISLANYDSGVNICKIQIPIMETTQPEEVEQRLKQIVSRFQHQEKTWG